jgi:hypothetical protein
VQTGELLSIVGVEGAMKTLTLNVAGGLVHPLSVVVTEYIPVATVPAPLITGFCCDELKALGPVQL